MTARWVNWAPGVQCHGCDWAAYPRVGKRGEDIPRAAARHVRATGHTVGGQPLIEWRP